MSELNRRPALSFFGGAGVPPAIDGRRDACPTYAAARGIPDAAQRKPSGFFARGSHAPRMTDKAKPV